MQLLKLATVIPRKCLGFSELRAVFGRNLEGEPVLENSTPTAVVKLHDRPSFHPIRSGLSPQIQSTLLALRTKEHLVELLPGSVIREFEHSTRKLSTVLRDLAQLQIVKRLCRKEFLKALRLSLQPIFGFFCRNQLLQILRQVLWLDRANPAFSIWIALHHFRMPRQFAIDHDHFTIDW